MGKMGIQLQSSSLPAHMKPMEAVKLFAKWNKTKIDDTMLDGLGIKEMEKKAVYTIIHRTEKTVTSCPCAYRQSRCYFFSMSRLRDLMSRVDYRSTIKSESSNHREKQSSWQVTIMAEVETLCDRIAILNSGNIAFCGTASELTDRGWEKIFYPYQDAARRQHL